MSFSGTAGDDTLDAEILAGPGVPVVIAGLGGRDRITGGSLADVLLGGTGDDTLSGGEGADSLRGGAGDDRLIHRLGTGNDTLAGNAGDDTVVLRFTAAEAADPAIQAAIAALQAGIAGAAAGGFTGTIAALGLRLAGIEALVVEVDPPSDPFAPIDLGAIAAGIGGFAIRGEQIGDDLGISAAGVGDIDGDGLADIVVSAWFNDAGGPDAGAAYFVRGKADGGLVQLAETIADDGGFRLTGIAASDNTGKSVSPAGDVNGDGNLDLLIGAPGVRENAGASYVVFGAPGLAGPIPLAAIAAGTGGFVIRGETKGDRAGKSNANAGDVNGDGLADLVIGARGDDDSAPQAGAAYVVFGKAGTGTIDLANVAAGIGGFKMLGEFADDGAGYTVAGIGDLNADGLADVIIGANAQDSGGGSSGAAYVVFGKTDGATVLLADVAAGIGGFKIIAEGPGDRVGIFVSPAGDVNGDGVADVIVGANGNGPGNAGAAYVVFGKADGAAVDLDAVAAGVGGFKIIGAAAGDDVGVAVSDAGDLNGDGLADLLVGARFATTGGVEGGAAYLVFGKADGAAVLLTDVLEGRGGVALLGNADGDKAGVAVSSTGDVNGDGLDDLLVAADGDDDFRGTAYVVFGREDWLID